jgi:hypothetical protein
MMVPGTRAGIRALTERASRDWKRQIGGNY